MDGKRLMDDPLIKELEDRLREIESQAAVHKSQIEGLMKVDVEHSTRCPAGAIFMKMDDVQKNINVTVGTVDLLKKFVIPLISIGNAVALTFLLLLFNSISTQGKDLNVKLDRFIERYNDAENLRTQYVTELHAYKEKVDHLEKEMSTLKNRSR